MAFNIEKDITVLVILYKTPFNKVSNLKEYKNFNLIIFEQGTSKNYKNEIQNLLGFKFRYYYSKKNIGLAKAVNFLINKTKTKYCMITEPDIFIKRKSILNLKKIILKDKNFLLVGPRYGTEKMSKNFKVSKKIDLSCVFFETKKMKKFTFYDEDFFFFWTDEDLVKRINSSNFKMVIAKNSYAKHSMSSSSNESFYINFLRDKSYKYGELIFDLKHSKLRLLKIYRQLFQCFFKTFFFAMIFNKIKFIKNFGYFIGIINFLFYFLLSR